MATVGITGYTGSMAMGDAGGGAAGANTARIPCVEKWGMSMTDELYEYICSDSNGAPTRLSGARDWSGNWNAIDHWPRNTSSGAPLILPGQTFQMRGVVKTVSGATNDRLFYGDVFCTEIKVDWNLENNAPLMYTLAYEGIGAPTGVANREAIGSPTAQANPARSGDCLGKGIGLVPVESSATETNFEITQMSLTVRAAKADYISSETAPYRGRVKGAFDMEASATIVFADPTALPTQGIPYRAKLYISTSTYFLCEFMRLDNIGGIDVNLKGDAPITAQLAFKMTSSAVVVGTPTFGQLELPSGTEIWPTGW